MAEIRRMGETALRAIADEASLRRKSAEQETPTPSGKAGCP
jgi:hypothetical protein